MPAATLAFDILARDKASRTLDKVANKADRTGRSVDTMARHTRTADTNTHNLGKSMRGLNDRMGGLNSRLLGVATAMGKIGAVGLGAGLVGVLKITADFQTQLSTLRAVTNSTGDEMKRVSDLAIALGNDLTLPGTSATDAADAMTELAKGGLDVTESMDAAKGVLQLSAAAQIENAEAATITANALNAFSLEADQAVRVSDLLAAASNASSAEITDVALAMQQAAAVFASANVPIEDLTTAIALMANAGVKGSDAGTSLKTMLTRVLTPASVKARNAMKKLGVDVFDANGNFIGMRKTILQFNKGLKGLTQEQRAAALNTIFGSDAIRAANIVLSDGVGKWDAMTKAVTEEGAAADLAKAKMAGLGGAFEGLKSVLETLALQLGLVIGPPIEAFARWLSEHLPGAVEDAKEAIGDLVDAVLPRLENWWAEHGDAVKEGWETLKTIALDAVAGIWGFIETYLLPALGDLAAFIVDTVIPRFEDVREWVAENEVAFKTFKLTIVALTAAWAAYTVAAVIAGFSTLIAFAPVILSIAGLAALIVGSGELWDRYLARPAIIAFAHIVHWVTVAIRKIRELIDLITSIPEKGLGFLGPLNPIQVVPGSDSQGFNLPRGDNGMVMPGPRGVHSLALVAGGETVLPTHKAPISSFMGGEEVHLHVTQHPGENQVDAGMRALRHHKASRVVMQGAG